MKATLQWFGTATWRLVVDDTVVWLDAYMDRAPTAAPLPYGSAGVDRADYVLVGHTHFDHVAGAGMIAKNTGATVVGSALTAEVVQDEGVAAGQTLAMRGGEDLRLGPLRVRVYPSLHGFNALGGQSELKEWPDPQGRLRAERLAALQARDPELAAAAMAHTQGIPAKQMQDGGPLAYLLEWDGFRLFWHDTPGMVRSSWEAAGAERPDVAILAAAAAFSTPNQDGQPFTPGQQAFSGEMAAIVRPGRVILNHHDDWWPPVTFHLDEESFRPHLEKQRVALEVHRVGEQFEL
jgi:L-ascorbate metabolism protein UlaG (beta-lactamase superfamily)